MIVGWNHQPQSYYEPLRGRSVPLHSGHFGTLGSPGPARRTARGPARPGARGPRRGHAPGDRPVHDGPAGAGPRRGAHDDGVGAPARSDRLAASGRAQRHDRARRGARPGVGLPGRAAEAGSGPGRPGVPPEHGPDDGHHEDPPASWSRGYLDSVEWRWVEGALGRPGPAVVWMRPLVPLVPGEEMTPLQRLLTCVDSASGVSAVLDLAEWSFMNTELTVHVRAAAGGRMGVPARRDHDRPRRGGAGRIRGVRRERAGRPVGPGTAGDAAGA